MLTSRGTTFESSKYHRNISCLDRFGASFGDYIMCFFSQSSYLRSDLTNIAPPRVMTGGGNRARPSIDP
jgi:hypothetical protein